MTVIPHPSLGDGKMLAQAARMRSILRSSLTKPWNTTASLDAEPGGQSLQLGAVVTGSRNLQA